MVQLYVFNPAPKLRLLSTLFFRGSKRILGSVSESTSPLSTQPRSQQCTPFIKAPIEAPRELVRDADYYADSRKGFCAFQVENTLFNVHQVLLSREPSAFGDMLCLPRLANSTEGSEETPVFLSDTVEQFRDFLWALYAPPNELFLETRIDRLLNVAELANKYCFASLEAWTIEHIYSLAKEPMASSLLHSASPDTCGRIIDVAILCNHLKLQELVTQHLISRTLWYNTQPEAILGIAEKHGLRTLIGVCYYRQLVNMERAPSRRDSRAAQTVFPQSINIDKSMRFLAAHRSLLSLWEHIRSLPPALSCEGCPSHVECELAWQLMWFQAGELDEVLRQGSADILGRMKALMLGLRKAMADAPSMTMQCKMAALEAITDMRDEVIEGLITHFMKPL
ncbi:hypothetical protein D9615_006434 [Tricholomella constricta]|uniref:BTB domain-containing protein n=1 Tax=Tricholomella constricta TaxID=117010 RepID=A0A8H5M196_9AGAR|nr:hypothetical protein D9615_006434 [Tricholomella constricta]